MIAQIRARPQLQQKIMIATISMIVGIMVLLPSIGAMALTPTPTPAPTSTPAGFTVNLNGMLLTTSSVFNGLFPVFSMFIGLGLAFTIIAYIIAEIRKAI